MRKYGYTKNIYGEKGSIPPKPSPSQDKESRGKGADFPECHLQLQLSPSKNFGETPRKLVTFGMINHPSKTFSFMRRKSIVHC